MSMAGPHGTDPDDGLPGSGMASGSDAGQPGGHLGPGDLAPDEERLLAALERDARKLQERPVEESLQQLRAAEDEAPLPGKGGVPDDGLTPRFTAPEPEG
ncbi:hypothetical protein [Blastococcus deserti]